jgi:hypothetical protein
MRSKLESIRKKLAKLDPTGGLCEVCAAAGPAEMTEVYVWYDWPGMAVPVADEPEPKLPERPKCLRPETCPGAGIRDMVIEFHLPRPGPSNDTNETGDDDPLGINADQATESESFCGR